MMVPLALITAVPAAGEETLMTLSGSPSGSESLASTLITTGVSGVAVALSALAIGGLLIGATMVMVTDALALPPRPSLMV